jgi:hypothetical protein
MLQWPATEAEVPVRRQGHCLPARTDGGKEEGRDNLPAFFIWRIPTSPSIDKGLGLASEWNQKARVATKFVKPGRPKC